MRRPRQVFLLTGSNRSANEPIMKSKDKQAKVRFPRGSADAAPWVSVKPPDALDETPPVVERPDGFYWQAPGLTEVGPFETYALACASRDAVGDDEMGRDEMLQAERDIGINDWIDAETGAPAEGQSPPRLAEG